MQYRPYVKTKVGSGRLFEIVGDKALIEFDYMYLVEMKLEDVDLTGINLELLRGDEGVNETGVDQWKEDCLVERVVDRVFDYAKRPANPYSYLYHNPQAIHTPQYFAHWTQKWQNHQTYMVLVKAAKITGYEPVPFELLYGNAKRDGYHGRSVRVGQLVFYLITPDEMSLGLKRRYYKFKNMLFNDIRQDIKDYYEEKEKDKALDLFDLFG